MNASVNYLIDFGSGVCSIERYADGRGVLQDQRIRLRQKWEWKSLVRPAVSSWTTSEMAKTLRVSGQERTKTPVSSGGATSK
eukprot:COSAG02_NODE_7154_length_3152_cov_1.172945_1_plen_82_part_00